MSGYDSRPLREDELHQRLAKSGHSLKANLCWATVPICNADDAMAFETMPVILPSEMVSSRDSFLKFRYYRRFQNIYVNPHSKTLRLDVRPRLMLSSRPAFSARWCRRSLLGCENIGNAWLMIWVLGFRSTQPGGTWLSVYR